MFQEIDELALMSSYKFLMQREYWNNKLAGDVEDMDLAFDDGKDLNPPLFVESIDIFIPGDLSCKLLKLSKNSDTSLYILLLAALKSLIYCYSANEDIIVVSPLYKFNVTPETINQRLFIHDTVGGDMTFKELVLNVRESTLKAYENQDYPSHKLLEYLYNTKKIQDIGPVIYNNILCALENIHDSAEVEKIINRLTFSFVREKERVRGRILYDPSVYEGYYVEQIAHHFVRVLEQATNYIKIKIVDIAFLSRQEKKRLLDDFNCTETELPHYKTVYEMFTEQVEKSPENSAVVCESSQSPWYRLTYAELNEQANSLASVLKEKGVGPNTIVPLLVEPSQEMIIGIIGILKAGACFLPIDPEFPSKRVLFMMEDTGAGILLTQSQLSADVEFNGEILRIDENLYRENISNPVDSSDSKNPLYVIYTSGTTGKPKGVIIKNINLINYVCWFTRKVELIPADKTILTSSFAFDLGYTVLFSSLLTGCQLHILRKEAYLSVKRLVKYIEEKEITFLKFTPSLFTHIVSSAEFLEHRLKMLRLVLLGGEAINLKDVEKAHAICPHIQVMNHYGPTEATIGSIARFIDFNRFGDYKKSPTIGKPINNTHAYILGKHLKLLPVGVPGELCIAGLCLAIGYLNRPQLIAEKFDQDSWDLQDYHDKKLLREVQGGGFLEKSPPGRRRQKIYKTGDLARWLTDGDIEFFGRGDQQVKIRGFRIELAEIEKRLVKHEKIKEALVSIKQGGEKDIDIYICAYIVSDPSVPEKKLTVSEIKEFLALELPEYMIPSYFVQIDSIPLTPNGKVNRKALPEPERGRTGGEYTAPRNENEAKLVEIWSDILKIDKEHISIDDNFFEFGGHSLKVIGLLGRIHKALDIEIPINQVFQNPTIRGLSTCMLQLQENEFFFLEEVEEKEYYLLSSAQKRLFTLQHMNLDSTVYNMPAAVVMEGELEREQFEHAFIQLINRHESLRTSFQIIDGKPCQRIHRNIDFAVKYYEASEEKAKELFSGFVRPFDLSTPPLIRVGLVEIERKRHILILDMHHIISDTISHRIFIEEFTKFYVGEELPELRLQYKDFSQWQSSNEEQEKLKKQEEYWLKKFAGKIPVLNMPIDFPRPAIYTFEGENYLVELDKALTSQIREFIQEVGVTLNIFLLAVYYVLLLKYTRQEDIVVGVPISGRRHSDLENIIGFFSNMLAMRNYPCAEKAFMEFLKEVKENSIKAYENQEAQFDDLIGKLKVKREPGRHPLVETVIAVVQGNELHLQKTREIEEQGLKLSRTGIENKIAHFDLMMHLTEMEETIEMLIEYRTALFKTSTIEEMAGHYIEILTQLLENKKSRLNEIKVSHHFIAAEKDILRKNPNDFDF